jgi:phosphatidylinositol alpha-1,6-mannosyltransferase
MTMRLLLITNDYPPKPGGIQQYLGNLMDAYPGPVRVLAPSDGPASATGRGEEVVVRNPQPFMWPTPSVGDWVVGEAEAFKPDVVLFGAPYPLPWLGPRIQEVLRVPVGVLCHGAEVTLPAAFPGSRQLLRRMLATADVRFAVSNFTAVRVQRLTGKPVHYIGAGVDLDTFHPGPPPNNAVPVVVCVSRFVPRKGQDLVIDAAARLAERGIVVEVLLVGKGRTEGQLRRRAERKGVDVRFEVDVPWDRLPDLYRQADVFCMPCSSRWGGLEVEGLGLVFLEAAATGLPVLAGDSGGAAETVEPARTGFVVHDIADIAEGIEMLVSDPVRAAEMGAAGRRRVEADFTWSGVVTRLVAGFEDAADRRSGGT